MCGTGGAVWFGVLPHQLRLPGWLATKSISTPPLPMLPAGRQPWIRCTGIPSSQGSTRALCCTLPPAMLRLSLCRRVALAASWPQHLRLVRGITGVAPLDNSQVLDSCGVQPYSEDFHRNAARMNELVEQLQAGGW